MKTVLITSAGKRVSLVKCFQSLGQEMQVLACDRDVEHSPACLVADAYFTVPGVNEPDYIATVLDLCIRHQVQVIVPTIDTELMVLAKNKRLFASHGIDVIVSDPELIALCRDKRLSADWLQSLGFRVPQTIKSHEGLFPFFAKPYDGSLSINTHVITCKEDLTPNLLNDQKMIYMEYFDPKVYTEFTVDMYYGKDHRVKSIVPRERLRIRAGEVNQGITVKNEIIPYVYERMKYIPGMIGCVCLQVFFNKETKEIIAFELNPRFGGGYPLTYHAGANYPKWIMEEYLEGKTIDYDDSWDDRTLMLRYDAEVIVKNYKDVY